MEGRPCSRRPRKGQGRCWQHRRKEWEGFQKPPDDRHRSVSPVREVGKQYIAQKVNLNGGSLSDAEKNDVSSFVDLI